MKKLSFLSLIILITACAINTNPGDGEKVGQIVKLSKVGMSCKTWEGQIVRGGFSGGNGVNGQSFDFTVASDSLAHVLDSLMDKQTEVRIKYHTRGIASLCSNDTDNHFLTSVAPLK